MKGLDVIPWNLISNLAYHEQDPGHAPFYIGIRTSSEGCLGTDNFCELAYSLRFDPQSLEWDDVASVLVGYEKGPMLDLPNEHEPLTEAELIKLDITEPKPIVEMSIDETVARIQWHQNLILRAKNGIRRDQNILLEKEKLATEDEVKKIQEHLLKFKPIQILDSQHKIEDDPSVKLERSLAKKKGITQAKAKKILELDLDDI